jgi:hypothetical protein
MRPCMETLCVWKDFWDCFHGSKLNYAMLAVMAAAFILLAWAAVSMLQTNPIVSVVLVIMLIIMIPVCAFLIDIAMYEHE